MWVSASRMVKCEENMNESPSPFKYNQKNYVRLLALETGLYGLFCVALVFPTFKTPLMFSVIVFLFAFCSAVFAKLYTRLKTKLQNGYAKQAESRLRKAIYARNFSALCMFIAALVYVVNYYR